MNTFEQLIGRKILNVLRLDTKEDYEFGFPLALFLQFDQSSGLLIEHDFDHDTTTLRNTSLDSVRNDFGIDYSETFLNELKPIDRLTTLIGQKIKSIKVGEFNEDKLFGDDFILKPGQYAGVIIEVDNQKLIFLTSGRCSEILFNSDFLFPNSQRWTLK